MLTAKRLGTPWFPIFCHALVHTVLMYIALTIYSNHVSELNRFVILTVLFLQLVTHFWIDVLKGKMNAWFPSLQSPSNKWHWIVFGADQFLHALVIIIMVNWLTQ